MSTEPVVVARVTRPHGIKGGLLLKPETDHADELFTPGRVLQLVEPTTGLPPSLTIVEAAPHGAVWRMLSEEVADRSSAERLRGVQLAVALEELPALADDEYFLHDLIGLRVQDDEGRDLGSVRDVYEGPADPLLAVSIGGRDRFIPFRREFVDDVDLEAGVLRVMVPDGLLDL